MPDKYLKLNTTTGRPAQVTPVVVSSGAGDAGRIPALDDAGLLDPSVLPATAGVGNYVATIGDGSATSIVVTHGLGTRNVLVQVYQAASPYAQVGADIEATSTTTVTLTFAIAPTINEFRVLIGMSASTDDLANRAELDAPNTFTQTNTFPTADITRARIGADAESLVSGSFPFIRTMIAAINENQATLASGGYVGLFAQMQAIAATGDGSAANLFGIQGNAYIDSATAIDILGLFGVLFYAEHDGSGDVTTVAGANVSGYLGGAGNADAVYGLQVDFGSFGSGTAAIAEGIRIAAGTTYGGPIGDAAGLHIENLVSGDVTGATYAIKTDGGEVRVLTGSDATPGVSVQRHSSGQILPLIQSLDETGDSMTYMGPDGVWTVNSIPDLSLFYTTPANVAANYQPLDSDLTAIAALTTTSFGRSVLTTADSAALRTAAALGTAATTNTGTGSANTILGNDSRLTDTRTPTAHAGSHAAAGSDPLTLSESQITNLVSDLALKAPLASPALTGTPTAPTAANVTSSTQLATTAFVHALITDLLNSAPSNLDTLGEIATLLAADDSALSALITTVAGKLAKASNLSDLTDASAARTNLSLVPGTNVQTWDADLDAIAALATTSYGRSLLTVASASALRTLAELVIGTDVQAPATTLAGYGITDAQPLDSDLTALAALSTTSYGRSVLAQVDAAALRTLAGLGSLATASSVTASQISDATANGRSLITAADYGAMRTLLGLVIGTNVQAWDTDLDALAALSTTSYGRSVLETANSAALRTLAGLVIGTNVQAYDAELAALAGLTSAADKGIQFTGSGTAATFDLTTAGKALLDDANAAAQRITLGVVIGTDVQAYDAELAALAGLTSAADKGVQFTGSGTAGTFDLTTAAKTILDDTSTKAIRNTLEVSGKGKAAALRMNLAGN